ncbi:MAG: hypothetical protein A2268_00290 [Candidatus Raymondbacteria bacterium RifOxyA12_full_50_37]|uniref:Redox-sensing transcriptional repressor Rex n=1 Tax=Candidatus Raymondbacteria bacterium RIFOXYD12_FULL_49_13 TaxID=1817890 RepID=A0A1F7F2X9_UNCRA|nr:MAG: hypothetical protein A2268_00290 [Candidatus Raymondbacteria bacterium RifOxyA12_full_50_37]OGJ92755.1 MAG: hypothetical protein A2248_04340 [Candidatus Raymondbacteria bacterium RIFOXYA2_FULL_49_16]OGK00958.1 MAG: hypothetical protein A2519_17000 [Candidatus Raymondbacteria bacterium RIFOXYD12_FULL_49_13]OGK04166.1 MAG: hypothetical protein A2350_02565 [Candidatus Raymondbacteria bacterium RifOxyB12_full_50_8]OGK04536.1 MAG: hypothetical protein A2487_08865 [Candidatus Raymondbacteria 
MQRKRIGAAVSKSRIRRLVQYKNVFCRHKELGCSRIYSKTIAESVGITGTQVRKDFSLLKLTGKKRSGYLIDTLLDNIRHILNKNTDENRQVILIGKGNLGSALMKYRGFKKEGFSISAAFDVDPTKCNKRDSFPVLPMGRLKEYVRTNKIKVAILVVPEIAAQQVLDELIVAGIKGVLNFAPCFLHYDERKVLVYNVNLEQELEHLTYFIGDR